MKTDRVKLSGDTLLNELMWPAARYCIGRHTYVSSYAETYWQIIRNNRKAFNEEELQFFARDIKTYIANSMRWWKNIDVEGNGNDRIKYDPYFLLTRLMYESQTIKDNDPEAFSIHFASTDFGIDCISGEVAMRKRERPLDNADMVWANVPDNDLEGWSLLARCISDAYTVQVVGIGEVEVIDAYEKVRYSANEPWRWEKRLRLTGCWTKYVPQEHIIEADR